MSPLQVLSSESAEILGALRRGWLFPLAGCLIGLMLAVSYILMASPTLYKSSARILVDRSMNRFLQTNKIIDEPSLDFGELQSQVQVLSSESIVLPVVRSMNLTQDSEFVGEPRSTQILQSIKKLVKRSIGWNDDVKISTDNALERIVVEDVFNRLNVYQEGSANVINVTFASKDPNKAADIANAIADTYLATSLEAKTKSTKIASV